MVDLHFSPIAGGAARVRPHLPAGAEHEGADGVGIGAHGPRNLVDVVAFDVITHERFAAFR